MTHQGNNYPYYSNTYQPQSQASQPPTQTYQATPTYPNGQAYYTQDQYQYQLQAQMAGSQQSWPSQYGMSMPTEYSTPNYPQSNYLYYPNDPTSRGPSQVPIQAPNDYESEERSCAHCGTTSTPEWRREPQSHRLLCNACGLHLTKRGFHRPQDYFTPQPPPAPPTPHEYYTGRQCSHCGTRNSPTWRRSVEGNNTLCNACGMYQRTHGRDRPLDLQSSPHFRSRKKAS